MIESPGPIDDCREESVLASRLDGLLNLQDDAVGDLQSAIAFFDDAVERDYDGEGYAHCVREVPWCWC